MSGCYEFDALGTLAKAGLERLELWCMHCTNRVTFKLTALIDRLGPATSLVMIARRARCRSCRRRGAHVQPARPGPPGTPHHDPFAAAPFGWTYPDAAKAPASRTSSGVYNCDSLGAKRPHKVSGPRLPEGSGERMRAVLRPGEGPGEFMRATIMAEIERREAEHHKAETT